MRLERDNILEKYSVCYAENIKYLKLIDELKSNEEINNSEKSKLREEYKNCLLEKGIVFLIIYFSVFNSHVIFRLFRKHCKTKRSC